MTDTTRIAPPLEPIIGNDGKQKFTDAPFYSHMTALLRLPNASAFGDPLADWRPFTADRKQYKPHGASNPRLRDVDVKAAQFARLAGIKNTAVLSRADYRTGVKGEGRMVTAQCRPTHNVPSHLSGLEPSADLAVFQPSDGSSMTVTGSEVRYLKRYRESMRGATYAAAMQHEQEERNLAFWRAAFPWIPCDSHGKLWQGKSYNRADGIGERIYSDGSMLSERKRDYDATNPDTDGRTMSEQQRLRMIEALRLESEADDAETRKRSRKVRAENVERTKALRF